ncbi:MAG: pilus assembly protein [Caulobacterales bacterium]|nr:pilus assembly protein [Caulobacterales bacterium]
MRALRPFKFLRRLGRDAGGATAIEFAFVAPPFLFMLFAIFELGRIYTMASVLEDATLGAGRLVRTGEIQLSGGGAEEFRQEVCSRMSVFAMDCDQALSVDVRIMPGFESQRAPDPVSGNEFDDEELQFDPGEAQQIVLVRTWWRTPLFAPLLTEGLLRLSDDSTLVTAATTFRNEPFA